MAGKSPLQENAIRPNEVRLGRVSGVFGISGEVRLFLHNRASQLFSGGGSDVTLVSPQGEREVKRLTARQGSGKRILGKLDGVSTPELARSYMDWELVVAEALLPEAGADEYYHKDLIGLTVRTSAGDVVGELTEIMEGEVIDCWVVKGPDGEVMFPAVKAVIDSVDLTDGIVISANIDDLQG